MNNSFYYYAKRFGPYQVHSMFGGTGLFIKDSMYALVIGKTIFLRGGDEIDEELVLLGCTRYQHIKKQITATVNYYDISHLFYGGFAGLDDLVRQSIALSVQHRKYQKSFASKRLRDLPNMQLTLERMVKKSGVSDVSSFMSMGAGEVFQKVRFRYGQDVDPRLLWKFAGAEDGIHWKLLCEPRKQALLKACN